MKTDISAFPLKRSDELDNSPLVCFTTKAEALGFLNSIVDKYGLCQKLCGIYPSANHCFHYEIGACKGACVGIEPPGEYNLRAQKIKDKYFFGIRNLLIMDTAETLKNRPWSKSNMENISDSDIFHRNMLPLMNRSSMIVCRFFPTIMRYSIL